MSLILKVMAIVCGTVPAMSAGAVRAETVSVAVATNFVEVIEALAPDFARTTAHTLSITAGSTGKLYAQIVNGAPFDVFLAADQDRPRRLEEDGIAEPGSRVTYTVGQLVLWSADPGLIGADGRDALRSRAFRRLAMANPDLAPYGAAARDALIALGLYETLRERIVLGENVGQAYALVATGNAELGFVARASLVAARDRIDGSAWPVPGALHPAIRQDAVLVRHRAQTPARQDAAQAFLGFLLQPDSQAAITAFGYAAPEGE